MEPSISKSPQGGPSSSDDLPSFKTLAAVSRRLLHLQSTEELAQAIINALEELLPFDYGAVLLIDQDTGHLIPFALSDQGNDPAFTERVKNQRFNAGQGIIGWVAQTGHTVCRGDVRQDPRYIPMRPGIQSELCVPIKFRDAILGVVNIESRTPHAYSDMDQFVLETMGAILGITLENVRLYASLQEQAAKLEQQVSERTAELSSLNRQLREEIDRHKDTINLLQQHADELVARNTELDAQ